MKLFLVGGAVRDEILGVRSKDHDFTVVLEGNEQSEIEHNAANEIRKIIDPTGVFDSMHPFDVMVSELARMGFEIFLMSPEHLTVRARFPKKSEHSRLTADFVLARKESGYSDGRRPDHVEPGTLEDDLARRDFTMNALAKDENGNIIDLFNGVDDINRGVIRAVGNPFDRLSEDALRAVRALRFSVTKNFVISRVPGEFSMSLASAMESAAVLDSIRTTIADERIADELSKMFRFDTHESLKMLRLFPALTAALFAGNVSLDSSMKQRGRGK